MKMFWDVILLSIILLFSQYSLADTEVGGAISENTTWTVENSPYTIMETITVESGITLNIEPGVIITQPSNNVMFLLHGKFFAHGTIDNKISIDGNINSVIFMVGPDSTVSLEYCEIKNHYQLYSGFNYGGGAGNFKLRHSSVNSAGNIKLEPRGDVHIEYNTFLNYGRIIGQNRFRSCTIYVRYNLFQNPKDSSYQYSAISEDGINYWVVKYNSFNNPTENMVRLSGKGFVDAIENYWGTTDTSVIDSLIFDNNDFDDYYGNHNSIPYLPILSEPKDSDNDGVPDNENNCPIDEYKTEGEICECEIGQTDTDSDGTPDCIDECDSDPLKTEPGLCGCGKPGENDSDNDGTPDCDDYCPDDPTNKCWWSEEEDKSYYTFFEGGPCFIKSLY